MKKHILFVKATFYIFLLVGATPAHCSERNLSPIPYIDFDTAMQKNNFEHVLGKNNNLIIYNFFKQLYERSSSLVIKPTPRITYS